MKEAMHAWYGSEMAMAKAMGLNTYSPYLAPEFIELTLRSTYNLFRSEIVSKNPFKRAKGQKIYSKLIERSRNEFLFNAMTSKGYRPIDLVRWYRYPCILAGKMGNRSVHVNEEFNSTLTRSNFLKLFENSSSGNDLKVDFKTLDFKNLGDFERRRLESLYSTIFWINSI